MCKIMEMIVKRVIMKHLNGLKLLSNKQYDFISGRSANIPLLRYLDKCIDTIINGRVIDSIYSIQFCKDF